MSAALLDRLEEVFGWLLTASWQASVLALLVLGLQWALGARLNPRWRYALWLLVLVRLLLPFQVESALSLFQFAPAPPDSLSVPMTQPLFSAVPIMVAPASVPLIASAAPGPSFSLYSIAALVWLAGVLVLGVLTFEVNRRFARQVAASPEVIDPAILVLFAETKRELNMRRAVRLVESAQVRSPAIMGLFRPALLLPARVRETFDLADLRLIFLHELAHLKRGDVIAQVVIALLQTLHWFNPLLWFAFRRMRADREPAADALVLSRAGEAEKERYGLMLVKMLEHFQQRHALPTLVGILEEKDAFKRRFQLIARFTRGAYGWSMIGVVCLCLLSAFCLTAKEDAKANHSPKTITMSETEARAKGIAALVNGEPINWFNPADETALVAEATLRSKYSGDELKRKLAQERYFRRDLDIDRMLAIQNAQAEGFSMPQDLLDERVNFGIKGFHGNKAAFVENLRKNGQTLEQFNQRNRDDYIYQHAWSEHFVRSLEEYTREHFPSVDFHKQRPTVEQDKIIEAERERIDLDWKKSQRSQATIQLFDDPEYPGARPPNFIVKTAAHATAKPNTPDGLSPKPAVKFHITFVEIDDQDYHQHAQAMDDAVRTGNAQFFRDKITRTTDLILMVGQSGWYSEGEVHPNVASAKTETQDRKPDAIQKEKSIFYGLNADFKWAKDGRAMNSTWSITAPLDSNPSPRLLRTVFADDNWDMAPDKGHAFWVGETAGWIRNGSTSGKSVKEDIKAETPSRLAVFLTAQRETYPDASAKTGATSDVPSPSTPAVLQKVNGQVPKANAPVTSSSTTGPPSASPQPAGKPDSTLAVWGAKPSLVTTSPQASITVGATGVGASGILRKIDDQRPAPGSQPAEAQANPMQIKVSMVIRGKGLKNWGRLSYTGNKMNLPTISKIDLGSATIPGGKGNYLKSTRNFPYAVNFDPPELVANNNPKIPSTVIPLVPTEFTRANVGWLVELHPTVDEGLIRLSGVATYTDAEWQEGKGVYGDQAGPIYGDIKDPKTGKTAHVLLSANAASLPVFKQLQTPFFVFCQPGRDYQVQLQNGANGAIATIRCEFVPAPAAPKVTTTTTDHLVDSIGLDTAKSLSTQEPVVSPPTHPPPGSIRIELKVGEIDDDVYLADHDKIETARKNGGLMGLLYNEKGTDMLSAPIVLANDGKPAYIEVVREFPFPTSFEFDRRGKFVPKKFKTADIGVTSHITPTKVNGKIELNCDLSLKTFEGFAESNVGIKVPTFRTMETHVVEEVPSNGELRGVWIPELLYDEQTVHETGKPDVERIVKKHMIVFLGARATD